MEETRASYSLVYPGMSNLNRDILSAFSAFYNDPILQPIRVYSIGDLEVLGRTSYLVLDDVILSAFGPSYSAISRFILGSYSRATLIARPSRLYGLEVGPCVHVNEHKRQAYIRIAHSTEQPFSPTIRPTTNPPTTLSYPTIQLANGLKSSEGAKSGPYWSIMLEISVSSMKPVDHKTILEESIKGLLNTELYVTHSFSRA